MRLLALPLIALVVLPQGTRPSVRVTTSYSLVGGATVDTAAATRDFVSGLGGESLVRVLPSLPRRLSKDAQVEPAEFGLMLSITGAPSRYRIVVRAIDVKSTRERMNETAQTASADSIPIIARELARRTARTLAGKAP
jgi:hypothetical protein